VTRFFKTKENIQVSNEQAPNSYRPLSANGKVLIIGGRDTNFPDWVLNHSQVVIWFNTKPAKIKKDSVPASIEVVILTRFVSHKLVGRIKKSVPAGVRLIPIPKGTGEIRVILEALGIQNPEIASVESRDEKPDEQGRLITC
jgi:hypothetical protein